MGVICKALKSDDKGMVELSEIVYFFKKNSKDKKISLKLILILLAKRLELEGKSTENYFKENNLTYDKIIDLLEFHEKVA